jgi:hypothetical protein
MQWGEELGGGRSGLQDHLPSTSNAELPENLFSSQGCWQEDVYR